jgi:hypothetical protein
MRSMILVNKKIPTNICSEINVETPDIMAIRIETNTSVVPIYNIYYDCHNTDSIRSIQKHP